MTSVGDVTDPETWRRANPAYPSRISHDFLLDQLETLGPELFAREHLCVWDPEHGAADSAFEIGKWINLADPSAERGAPTFGLATAPDHAWCAVGVAWQRPDGRSQVMLADYRPGTTWVTARVAELRERWGGAVLADTASRGLVTDAEVPSQAQQAVAHNALADAVEAGSLHHGNEPALNTAVRSAQWKSLGDTRVLDRKGGADISPIIAVALALHGLNSTGPSVYEERGFVAL